MTNPDKHEQMPDKIWAGIYHHDDEVTPVTAEWRNRKITGSEPYIRLSSVKVPDGLEDALFAYDRPDISGGVSSRDLEIIVEAALELLRIKENTNATP
jgi:hypothetical protein